MIAKIDQIRRFVFVNGERADEQLLEASFPQKDFALLQRLTTLPRFLILLQLPQQDAQLVEGRQRLANLRLRFADGSFQSFVALLQTAWNELIRDAVNRILRWKE